ncbi:TPA: transposase [Bacillus pseudomycoides]|nr:transposase [Bacillus pseudomycoides]
MANYDRKEHLKAMHASRKATTYQKVDEAIQRLLRASEPINFNSVRNEAGVSKATLYNNQELRERIESLRQQQAQAPTPKQMKRQRDDNNKDAMIDLYKRRIKKLEAENKQLRDQLKVAYADVYKKI